mmetsp:Transcript_49697/g.118416  ORF Transcript_49697/g.118416 Transcript_49697/m.118416 type:complete len:987 (+) Transcript_49697:37-2997(+)
MDWRKPGFLADAPEVCLAPQRPRSASVGSGSTSRPGKFDKEPGYTWGRVPRFSAQGDGDGFAFQPQARTVSGDSSPSAPPRPPPRPLKAATRPVGRGMPVPGSNSTWLMEDTCSVSIPGSISVALQALWRQVSRRHPQTRFLVVLETCQKCEKHATTTKHDPAKYQGYCKSVVEWVQKEFAFIEVKPIVFQQEQVRIGAFEVYLLSCAKPGQPADALVLHSKLASLKWPCRQNFIARLEAALPSVVAKARSLHGRADWDHSEATSVLEQIQTWGLDTWEPAAALAHRSREVTKWTEHGHKATASGDTHALREAVHQGASSGVSADLVLGWREALKGKNMSVFNLKQHARRLHKRVAFAAAVRGLAKASVKPVRIESLRQAVESAHAAEVAEEDIDVVATLLERCTECVSDVKSSLEAQDLDALQEAWLHAETLALRDSSVDEAESTVSILADEVGRAKDMHDLLQMDKLLTGWKLPKAATAGPVWTTIVAAEAERRRLQALVKQAEQLYSDKQWEPLQIVLNRLQDAQVDGEAWDRWTRAMKAEKGWVVIKAVSGTAPVLRAKLHTKRLQAAMSAPSIREDAYEQAIADAQQHADAELVSQARSELSAARKRWAAAAEAIDGRLVDTAEVMLWKLRQGRIRLGSVESKGGPLVQLTEAVWSAEAADDWEAMQQAIEGWKQDKVDSDHKAFAEDNSPTKALRHALRRIPELRAQDVRRRLDEAVDALRAGSEAAEPEKIRDLVKELQDLGADVPLAQRARILALHASSSSQPARFGLALLRVIEAPTDVVVLLDQSKAVRADNFAQHMKPAVKRLAQALTTQADETTSWGAVAYGPMKLLQELTKDMSAFNAAIDARKFGGGESRTTSKALRKALDLFKSKGSSQSQDPQRIVFNFAAGAPENLKDTQKTLKYLEAIGVVVVGVGIGPLMSEDESAKISSTGLAFHIEGFNRLASFLEEAFVCVQTVLDDAKKKTVEEILHSLGQST